MPVPTPGKRPLVSIVTPVYNEEKYLAACVESVLRQTYGEWEYIILDNCSKDGSLGIAREFAARDSRIKVVASDVFRGQEANHNHLLTLIAPESRYCKVVLGDDWIFPECLERMVDLAEANPRAGIVSSYWLSGDFLMGSGFPNAKDVLTGREACRLQLLQGHFFLGSPSTLLIRSEIVRARVPFYDASSLHSDTEACYDILREWDLAFVHQVLTFIRIENVSVSSAVRRFHPNGLDKFIIVHNHAHRFLDGEELRACRDRTRERYLAFLAENLFPPRDSGFWDYHRRGLATIGVSLDWRILLRPAAWELLDILLNPKKTLGRIAAAGRKAAA